MKLGNFYGINNAIIVNVKKKLLYDG